MLNLIILGCGCIVALVILAICRGSSSDMVVKNCTIGKGSKIEIHGTGGSMIIENSKVNSSITQKNRGSGFGHNVQRISGCTVNAPIKQINTKPWKSHNQTIKNREVNTPITQRNGQTSGEF